MNDVAPTRITSIELASEMKNLLEGRGMSINAKLGRKKLTFVGCYSLIASNNLPNKKYVKEQEGRASEWTPFEDRCLFIELSQRYDLKGRPTFTK